MLNAVRGDFTAMYEFERLPLNQTKMTFTCIVACKGSAPKALSNLGMKGLLEEVRRASEFFEVSERSGGGIEENENTSHY